jgi:hypothetical protein
VAGAMSTPNSQHQTWARWTFVVHAYAHPLTMPDLEAVKQNCARFFGKLTRGGAALLNIEQVALPTSPGVSRFVITLRWDNRQALDTNYQAEIGRLVGRFFAEGFGPATTCHLKPVVIEAGDAEDGKPPAQLLIVPSLASTVEMRGV